MNKVFGRVLLKGTRIGVPDLVVVVFDADPQGAIPVAPTTGPAPAAAAAGDRLGSTLTDAAGRFELSFELAAFVAGDPERRPDLVVGVLAPEDGRGPDDPTTAPPAERLLVHSNLPRMNAGEAEAYVLRVTRAQLERFGIPVPGVVEPQKSKDLADRFIAATQSAQEVGMLIRQGLAPMRRERLQKRRKVSRDARKFVEKIGAAPLRYRRRENFYVGADDDPTPVRQAAMAKGLKGLQERISARPLILEITHDDLAAGNISSPGIIVDVPLYENLTHEQVCRLIGRRRGGVALQRVMDLVQARKAEVAGADRIDNLTAQPDAGSGTPNPPGSPEPQAADPRAIIETAVLGELIDLAAPATAPAATMEELTERIAGFKLPPGPADVTAFHDYHQLQVAFQHVWTEAFDREIKDRVLECYSDIVRLHEDLDLEVALTVEQGEFKETLKLLELAAGEAVDAVGEPGGKVSQFLPDAAAERWPLFTDAQRAELSTIAIKLEAAQPLPPVAVRNGETIEIERFESENRQRQAEWARLRAKAQAIIDQPAGVAGRLVRLLDETRRRLSEPYAFHYFAPNSHNFGILVTYRQTWEPLAYQVGDLVATIPLAPGEVRRFSSKTVVRRTRAQKEIERALASRSGESTLTQRAEAEIAEKASLTTNFKHTASGTFNFAIGDISASAEFVTNQAQESASVKKALREAVIKSAAEYKNERALEVESTLEATTEASTSGEIANTNNELTVTYLLYELERQYRISERIHRVMPVILVAQDMPAPHEITEGWLLAHEWILRRVILDDGLLPAVDQLREAFAGDELALGIKRGNWERQKDYFEKLDANVAGLLTERDRLRELFLGSEYSSALAKAADDAGGFLQDFAEALAVDLTGAAVDALEAGVKKIQKQLDFLQESLTAEQQKLSAAKEALDAATREYTQALEAQTNRRVALDQLRVHIKDNILYYMQAIWDHEPPDQRFFRLYHQSVELPEAPTTTCRLRRATAEELALGIETICRDGNFYVLQGCEAPELPDPANPTTKQLVEIADLDRPLGYKGNYIIFPLKTCVYLTEFMMKEFVDTYFGVRDPDPAGNYSTEELLAYLESVFADPAITLTEEEREAALGLVKSRVREPRRESDIVVVPSGQLFIEALLGAHPLLERFKQVHRAYDVGKARAELRRAELDNLRRAARLLRDEPDLEDPDVDKRIVIEGSGTQIVADHA